MYVFKRENVQIVNQIHAAYTTKDNTRAETLTKIILQTKQCKMDYVQNKQIRMNVLDFPPI